MKNVFLLVIIVSVILVAKKATAEDVKYKLQLLPIDCIFEVIDIGTQQLRYLTPETCPSEPVPPAIESPAYTSNENPITIKPAYYYISESNPEFVKDDSAYKQEVASAKESENFSDLIKINLDSAVVMLVAASLAATTIWLDRFFRRNR